MDRRISRSIVKPVQSQMPFNVAFVCTGNICSSPLAETLARTHAERSALQGQVTFESFGTHDYHVGEPADRRSIAIANEFGIDLSPHRARHFSASDFDRFDLVFAMDGGHERILRNLSPTGMGDSRIQRYLPYLELDQGDDVPDPYYGDREGFVAVHRLLDRAAQALVERLPVLIGQRHG